MSYIEIEYDQRIVQFVGNNTVIEFSYKKVAKPILSSSYGNAIKQMVIQKRGI